MDNDKESFLEVYTDGGCSGNPGVGAWAYILLINGTEKTCSDNAELTTNNRMELTAIIMALKDISGFTLWREKPITLYTDSQYVQKGITQWIKSWQRNGWQTASGKKVKNQDLWQKLQKLDDDLTINWMWVQGHEGNEFNEKCDSLVKMEIKHFKKYGF